MESFQTDIHSRDHRVTVEVAAKRDGTILGMTLDDLAGVGPFSMYPRSSVVESGQVLRTTPGPYRFRNYRRAGASSSRTRRRCPSTARSAIRWPRW